MGDKDTSKTSVKSDIQRATAEDDLKRPRRNTKVEKNKNESHKIQPWWFLLQTQKLTFAGVVGQNGAGPHLFALDGLTGARLGARGPRGPAAQDAVPRARHIAGFRLQSFGGRAQLSVHLLSWT